jgi:hypothetical protein
MKYYELCSEGRSPSTTNYGERFKLYAVWHHCHLLGTRGACAISENPETLMPLHLENTKNPQSLWHNYKHNVSEVKAEPIECYTYNAETKSIEQYNDNHKAEDHDFYAFNPLCNEDMGLTFYDDIALKIADSDGNILDNDDFDDFDKGEVLIYLSKGCHKLWRECSSQYREAKDKDDFIMDPNLPSFFYTDWTSDLPVEQNVYYEEGIMNA